MKKIVFIAALSLLSVLLLSCAVPYSFLHGEPDVDAIQIEIVYLDTEMGKHTGSPYSEENISVNKVIESDKKEETRTKNQSINGGLYAGRNQRILG